MAWAVVIAFVAVAIAIGLAVAGLRQIAEVRSGLEGFKAELRDAAKRGADQAGEVAAKKVEFALKQLEVSKQNYEEAVGTQRLHTGLLYLSADSDVTHAGGLADELARYTVRTLDHEASLRSAPLILRGGLYSGHPAVLDIAPRLIRRFIGAIGAELLYSQDDGSHGRKFYLRWPGGADELAALLRSLLAGSDGAAGSADEQEPAQAAAGDGASGASDGTEADEPEPAQAAAGADASDASDASDGTDGTDGTEADEPEPAQAAAGADTADTTEAGEPQPVQAAAGDDTAEGVPGVAELDALFDAVRYGHPVALHIGQLVAMNVQVGTAAGLAPEDWMSLTEDQQETAITGIGGNILEQIGATAVIDLSQ